MTTAELENYQIHDLETLERLFQSKDPRGLAQMIEEDAEFEDTVIEKVGTGHGRTAEITRTDGWSMLVDVPEDKEWPKAGDQLRVYGRGIGFPWFGYAINGDVYKYETPFERFATRIKMLASSDRRRREQLDAGRDDLDTWYSELTGPYAARIARFRERPDFEVEAGSYETYPVLMAQRIEAWVRDNEIEGETPHDVIERFRQMAHGDQAKAIHAGKEDKYGISGHQFDCACGLALAVLEGKEI